MFLLSRGQTPVKLWQLLEKQGALTQEQFKAAVKQASSENKPVAQLLLENQTLPQDKVLSALAEFFGVPAVILRKRVISHYVLNLIPKEVADEHLVVVFKKEGQTIHVAMVNPADEQTIAFIKKKTGLTVQVYLTTPADITYALRKYQAELSTEFAKILDDSIKDALGSDDPAEKLAQHVPIIKMVDSVIDRAITQGASDIHIEPTGSEVVIRFRIDGMLHRIVALPAPLLPPLTARLKLMASIKLDEYRIPQDGRFRVVFNDREVAMRVSTIPTLHGTKIVMRLLDTRERQFSLSKLGFNQRDLGVVKTEISKPHGLILVTGPTGSGKTTTLYSFLKLLHKENINICTVEDPIEYGVEGINQMQINPVAGLTFASGLRSLLRQDPDVIMVGEIRDTETADMAINAAMTGHLVLATLHTNSAFLAVQRMVEMGVQPFLVASIVNLIIGQRLVRKICGTCRQPVPSPRRVLEGYEQTFNLSAVTQKLQRLGLLPPEFVLADTRLYTGHGCPKCNDTGYQGRVGIYEVLPLDKPLAELITGGATAEVARQAALDSGVLTMTEDGVFKVLTGQTTFEEVTRVTRE